MIKKIKLISITTIRLLYYLAFTRKLEYHQVIQKLKSSHFDYIKTKAEVDFAFRYVSFACRKLPINNPCVVVSFLMFEASPPGGTIHFGVDSKQGLAHSWYEWNGINYTTDRSFEGSIVESVCK